MVPSHRHRASLAPIARWACALVLVASGACTTETDDGSDPPADTDPDAVFDAPPQDVPVDGPDDGDTDAPDSDACAADTCAPSSSVTFTPEPDPFGHTFAFDPLDDPLGIGPGGALLDSDGDGDVDVFLGDSGDGTAPCLYENRSAPGALRFDPVPAVCTAPWWRRIHTGLGLDIDGDGAEELLVGGSRYLGWAPAAEDMPPENLFDLLLESDDRRSRCDVGALVPVDLDLDGDLEVYVACGHAPSTAGPPLNMVFEPGPEQPRFWSDEEAGLLADRGHTLAVAVLDLDGDGLLDLALADDTLSGPGARNLAEEPGGGLVRGAPPDVDWTLHRYAGGNTAWGSFMGVGALRGAAPGDGATLYLTDRGPNRTVTFDGETGFAPPENEAWTAAELGYGPGNDDLFAWGAVTADFDGDGDVDLYVTQGDVWPDRIQYAVDVGHEDALVSLENDAPTAVTPRSVLAPTDADPRRNVRSAAALDLDGDGLLELLTVPLDGGIRIDRVTSARPAPVCRLQPSPSVVPSRALGYAVRVGGRWRPAEIEGRSRLGGPPELTVPADSDALRFPSGLEVGVVCAPGEPFPIAEPPWLTVTATEGAVHVEATAEVEVRVSTEDGTRTGGVGSYDVSGDWTVAIRHEGRWVPRLWRGTVP